MLYFSYPSIVLQEVPDEISLALSISGCNLKCNGCHSAFTWNKQFGEELTDTIMNNLIQKNKHITCVLFYGGEWNERRLLELLKIVASYNLKRCLYTGLDFDNISTEIKNSLEFLKCGRYIAKLGNLNSRNTNQRFFKKIDSDKFIDITNLFYSS